MVKSCRHFDVGIGGIYGRSKKSVEVLCPGASNGPGCSRGSKYPGRGLAASAGVKEEPLEEKDPKVREESAPGLLRFPWCWRT